MGQRPSKTSPPIAAQPVSIPDGMTQVVVRPLGPLMPNAPTRLDGAMAKVPVVGFGGEAGAQLRLCTIQGPNTQ